VRTFICKNWDLVLKETSNAKKALDKWKKAGELKANTKIKAPRSDNVPEVVQTIEGWRPSQGIQAQFMASASSYQNRSGKCIIGIVENSMSAMLNNAALPLEFWDEVVSADIYIRNRTNTGPIIDSKTTSLEEA
jgi:hypothetical protein